MAALSLPHHAAGERTRRCCRGRPLRRFAQYSTMMLLNHFTRKPRLLCTPDCTRGRKEDGSKMVGCDACDNWWARKAARGIGRGKQRRLRAPARAACASLRPSHRADACVCARACSSGRRLCRCPCLRVCHRLCVRYHTACVSMTADQADAMKSYVCAQCTEAGLATGGYGAEVSLSPSQQRNANSSPSAVGCAQLSPTRPERSTETGAGTGAGATFVTR